MIFETWAQRLAALADADNKQIEIDGYRSFYDVGYSPSEAYELGKEDE